MLNINPERVFYYFEEISKIPHGSGNCRRISEYCIDFAKKHLLEYYTDELHNVVIKKNSNNSLNGNPVILQGHLDMVCEKECNLKFDFSRDSLNLKVEGDWLSAQGTTLGGDDGIAVAVCLAILEDENLTHPPLEVVFTVDEETGMFGAVDLDIKVLKGKSLINIDSENEGVITVSCAGGVRADISIPLNIGEDKNTFYEIKISGLLGGHSGVEIHKKRENANKLLGSLLKNINDCRIKEISGGAKDNVIPRSSGAVISSECDVLGIVNEFLKGDFNEKPLITVNKIIASPKSFDKISSDKIISFLNGAPNGVIEYSKDIKDLVETSLNLGTMITENNTFLVTFALRSSVTAKKKELLKDLTGIAKNYGGTVHAYGDYPAWEYRKDSPLRDTFIKVYKELYGKEPVIEAIHAGLECGLFADKIEGLDAVSIGPDMRDIHSPKEKLSVSSVQRTYEYIKECLKCLAKE